MVSAYGASWWPLCILVISALSIAFRPSHYQASAAPIPPRLSRQPPNSFNNTFFPYTVLGPVPPPVHQPGSVLDTCFTENTYAISFDDGPGQLTDELLDFLDEQNLKVTFFVNGDNWSCVYSTESQRLLKRAYAAQHQIAAHPWSHQDLESLSDDAIRQEMFKMEQAFRQILGVVPRYMRPPFGEHSPRVRSVLQQLGYVLVLWDVDQHPAKAKGIESSDNSPSAQKPMGGHAHHHSSSSEQSFASNRAEAVRGVPPAVPLDRDAMSLSGIFQEATSIWALEYVESVGYAIQPVGTCLGEVDPRLWYKEIGPAAPEGSFPMTCS
ncbi:Carbohydrate esterase 4 protein [Mortierella antarctica]|nr:Carbohydrate esterase 4 protein [Mortierella antarctica]